MSLLSELPLNSQLFKALDKLGFTDATDVQSRAIPPALDGRDIMVSAKTGSGKTAAFLLPLLHKLLTKSSPDTSTRALILLPTRELALQTQKTLETLAAFTYIKSGLLIGGEPFKYQIASLRKNPEIIIATPGRLVEHIEKGTTDFTDLEVLILDEADRMLDMGFSEDMETIIKRCHTDRQILLFSATLKHKNIARISGLLNDPLAIVVDSHRESQDNIAQQIILADDDKHKQALVASLLEAEDAQKAFVFCNTRVQCQQLGNDLMAKGLKVGYIHSEISQSARKQVLNQFRDGKLKALIATDVAARGLDIKEVGLVINYAVPHSGSDHIHRTGRTGRAGEQGLAITLVGSAEWNLMSSIERYLKIQFERIVLPGLKGNYKGPKKLKSSGKAASKKKKVRGVKKTRPKKTTRKNTQSTHYSDGEGVFKVKKKPTP